MLVLTVFAFLAGIMTILSPCILPVLPIVLASGVNEGRRRPLGLIAGFVLSFTFIALALQALVIATGIAPDILRYVAVAVLVLFGFIMIVPGLGRRFSRLVSGVVARLSALGRGKGAARKLALPRQGQPSGFWAGFPVGLSLGFVWSPCVGPIMASVISVSVSQSVDAGAFFIALAYSLGTAVPMFGIMVGGRALLQRFPKLQEKSQRIQQGFGVVIVAVAAMIALGLDRELQSAVLRVLPEYSSAITVLEDLDVVQEALSARRASPQSMEMRADGAFMQPAADVRPVDVSQNFGRMPELVAQGPWILSEPLSQSDLAGKVVLIDFWTYSCINCQRTLPYLRSWHEKYADKGLQIIGVHSPEFAFERSRENVEQAMARQDVTWPVVLDNNFAQWEAYENRYWPAKYLIDANGNVRYFHFGEGNYEETELAIQSLLYEAGQNFIERVQKAIPQAYAQTPETYLGASRAQSQRVSGNFMAGALAHYELQEELEPGQWSLGGEWLVRSQYIVPTGEGQLDLSFNAASVFLVAEPEPAPGQRRAVLEFVLEDSDGVATQRGEIELSSAGTYKLFDLAEAGQHRLRLIVPEGLRLYAFTFGA